jgi:hypothetical protein
MKNPRRDSNPHLRVEGPVSSPFDHGGSRLRRQGSNLRLASNSRVSYRLDHAGTAEAAGLEPARRCPPYALARRCLTSRPCFPTEGEGVEPPRPLRTHPFSRRGTAPVAVLPSDFGRRRTCNLPIKSRVLCRIELRSQAMWSAGIEPAAPRVSSERSTGLSYDHTWARLGSNQRPPVCKTGARTD